MSSVTHVDILPAGTFLTTTISLQRLARNSPAFLLQICPTAPVPAMGALWVLFSLLWSGVLAEIPPATAFSGSFLENGGSDVKTHRHGENRNDAHLESPQSSLRSSCPWSRLLIMICHCRPSTLDPSSFPLLRSWSMDVLLDGVFYLLLHCSQIYNIYLIWHLSHHVSHRIRRLC